MNAQGIFDHIRNYVTLSSAEEKAILKAVKFRKYMKGEFVVQAGEVCQEVNFVNSGCLKSFRVDENGKEHIVAFAVENWWTGDLGSYIARTPADYNVQCLEDSELVQFRYEVMEQVYQEVPAMERFFRLLLERSYVAAQRRVIDRMSLPAKDIFLRFLKNHPGLQQRVPQYLVASYLGITPQFLSKIRRELLQE